MDIDPSHNQRRGKTSLKFRFLEEAGSGNPLGMRPDIDVSDAGLGESGITRSHRVGPIMWIKWEGRPSNISPEGTFLTQSSQDHLVFGPLCLWCPEVADPKASPWIEMPISHPDPYHLATNGSRVSEESRFGCTQSTSSFDGLKGNLTIPVQSKYPTHVTEVGDSPVRNLCSPVDDTPVPGLAAASESILGFYEAGFGPCMDVDSGGFLMTESMVEVATRLYMEEMHGAPTRQPVLAEWARGARLTMELESG